MTDQLTLDIVRRLAALERWAENFKLPETLIPVSRANVSNPPTDAEADAAFGLPANVGAGFLALIDDNNADAAVWLVTSNGTSWWRVTAVLTKLV